MFKQEEIMIEFSEFDNNLREDIIERMEKYTFCVIRGAIAKKDVLESMSSLKRQFSQLDDHPTVGEKPRDIQDNFQKLLVGGVAKKYNNFPRFFRTIYNPLWAEDKFGLKKCFKQTARLRNLLLNKPLGFALEKIEDDGLWTASRIHQYPTGGGFFTEHRDTTIMDIAREKKIGFYQLILVLSVKGVDFETGGAFIESHGERVSLEDYLELGDIAIYDGTTIHGVEEIDSYKNLVLNAISGRTVGFVSLYKDMS